MAASYLCGFEMQSLAEANSSTTPAGGTNTVQNTTARNGYALQSSAPTTTGTVSGVRFARVAAGGTATTGLFSSLRFYVRFVTLPTTGNQVHIAYMTDSASTPSAGLVGHGIAVNADGSVGLRVTASVVATSAAGVVTTGGWYRFDLDTAYSSGTGIRLSVDGTSVCNSDATATSARTYLWLGSNVVSTSGGNNSSSLFIDDVVAYTSSLSTSLADYNLNLLKPTADSAVGNWKRNDGSTTTSLFSAVDNTPPTGTAVTNALAANYIQNATAGSSAVADQIDLACAAYNTISGLSAGSQVSALMAICNDAQQVTTGSPKSAALGARMTGSGADISIAAYTGGITLVGLATTGGSNHQQVAQSFVATGAVAAVTVYLVNSPGTPTDFVAEIQTDSAGAPSGTVVGSTGAIPVFVSAGYSAPVAVSAPCVNGTLYWLVIRRTGALSDTAYLTIGTSNANAYTSGGESYMDTAGTWTVNVGIDAVCTVLGGYASDITFDFGLPQGTAGSATATAQGAYPTGWGTHVGSVTESPNVTSSDTPVVRVKRTGTYTRVVSIDMAGVYVMWAALTSPPSLGVLKAGRVGQSLVSFQAVQGSVF